MHCIMGLSKVSELRAGEGNNSNGSSLEGSGSSYLDVAVTHLDALAPLSGILLLWLALAFNTIEVLNVDAGLSIAGNDFGESVSILSLGNSIDNFLLCFDSSNGLFIGVVTSQELCEVITCVGGIWNFLEGFCESIGIINYILGKLFIEVRWKSFGLSGNGFLQVLELGCILIGLFLGLLGDQLTVFSFICINCGLSRFVVFSIFLEGFFRFNRLEVKRSDHLVIFSEDLICWSTFVIGVNDINRLVSYEILIR